MNENHALCGTTEWSHHMRDEVVSYVTDHVDLGTSMLEIGPGPGAATEWLRHEVKRLVAVELDAAAASSLAERFAGTNVEVVVGDATRLACDDESFDSVGCFTMLHHVPTACEQNAILAEAWRVLRPGGALAASDSLPSNGLHHFHAGDTYNPVDPASVIARLQTVGFDRIDLHVGDVLKFVARKPRQTPRDDEACGEGAEDPGAEAHSPQQRGRGRHTEENEEDRWEEVLPNVPDEELRQAAERVAAALGRERAGVVSA